MVPLQALHYIYWSSVESKEKQPTYSPTTIDEVLASKVSHFFKKNGLNTGISRIG